MEPVLIVTDAQGVDRAAVQSFSMDLAYGTDEQDFVVSFERPVLGGGEFVYIDGTAYGGVVDVVETESNNTISTYRGRTWHGILSGKIIAPAYNQDYVTVTGDANACIGTILARIGLDGPYAARSTPSGIQVVDYRFARFCNAYDGLTAMLEASGAKLMLERRAGVVEVWAEPVAVISDEADSDLLQFVLSVNHRVPNHLVCAGEGELSDRVRLDLYADAAGNVSTTQTLFGVDEIAVYYDYTGADLDALRADGTKALKAMQVQGNVDTDVAGVGDWAVGDVIEARDNRVGRTITARIVKKIVRVERGALRTEYEVGLPSGTSSSIHHSTEGGGGGVVYTAGPGIQIASGVISAEVTQDELDLVADRAEASVATIAGSYPVKAVRSGSTVTVSHELSGVVAGSYGPQADLAPAFGDTVTIPPQIAMDQEGHITIANERKLTIPSATATQQTAGLMSAADKAKLDGQSASIASTTTTLSNLGTGTHTLYLYRQGNIVTAQMNNNTNVSTLNSNINTGTVPDGYKPKRTAFQRGDSIANGSFSGRFRWYVNTSGSVMFTTDTSGARETQMTMTWYTEDPFPE